MPGSSRDGRIDREQQSAPHHKLSTETASFAARVSQIKCLLDAGRTAEAIFLANFTKWPDPKLPAFAKANFDPEEPRDDSGRWTKEQPGSISPLIDQVQYRGHFHDLVVKDLIEGLNASGGKAIANIPVFGINGVLAIPDGASLPERWIIPYFIEVKTGIDPPFTANQQKVYPLICAGGHAVSLDPRIAQLGLKTGELLPPMDIMVCILLGQGGQ
jgi:hypothetical protein